MIERVPVSEPSLWIRLQNPTLALVFKTLWSAGPLSRADLSERTSLAFPTVSRAVKELADEGYLQVVQELESSGGRRPSLLGINPTSAYAMGIDVGGSKLAGALLDLHANVHATHSIELPGKGKTAVGAAIAELARAVLDQAAVPPEKVLGMGVGVSGSIDRSTQRIISASNLDIEDWDVVSDLTQRLQMPVVIENDANTAALGELHFGTGQLSQHLAFVSVGTGIGLGLILFGQPFHGASGQAGELGHTPVLEDGPQCTCGRRGCLEAIAGAWALAREFAAQAALPQEVTAKVVFSYARAGDLHARRVVDRAAKFLGFSVAGLVNTLGVYRIAMGGGIIQNEPDFFHAVRRYALEQVLPECEREVVVAVSELGDRAGIVGGATLAIQGAFSQAGTTR